MFAETHLRHKHKHGTIEVICGSMFSGKTEELIRRIRRAQFAKQKVEIFKPLLDKRYDDEKVVSHNATAILSTPGSTLFPYTTLFRSSLPTKFLF